MWSSEIEFISKISLFQKSIRKWIQSWVDRKNPKVSLNSKMHPKLSIFLEFTENVYIRNWNYFENSSEIIYSLKNLSEIRSKMSSMHEIIWYKVKLEITSEIEFNSKFHPRIEFISEMYIVHIKLFAVLNLNLIW